MIRADQVPVKPRVVSPETGDILPAEEVLAASEAGDCIAIEIVGEHGSGKTTTLEYLASLVGPGGPVLFLDDADPRRVMRDVSKGLVVYTSPVPRGLRCVLSFRLAPWSNDELVEYLLAVHPDQCRSVMGRLGKAPDRLGPAGNPRLWRIVLDAMAEDESLQTVQQSLETQVEQTLPQETRNLALKYCLEAIAGSCTEPEENYAELWSRQGEYPVLRTLHHPFVRTILAAERMAGLLERPEAEAWLHADLSRELVRKTASKLSRAAIKKLRRLLSRGPQTCHPMAASILHATGSGWRPDRTSRRFLPGAHLSGAVWPGIDLREAYLVEADLSRCDLTDALLDRAEMRRANISDAVLDRAHMQGVSASGADFSRAALTKADARQAILGSAILLRANLEGACLIKASFYQADLSAASLVHADLSEASLLGCKIEGADFSFVNLAHSGLTGLALRVAHFAGARFSAARLERCDLEGMELAQADFEAASLTKALLTSSRMPGANFAGASLREAALADIQWEGAILRDADLRGCTFHMGSTRSGLVGSPIACEGSRTGFYTDEFDQQTFRPPEEIRKANLCRADLRGANIEGVDFYLVDLREALYTQEQREHFLRCRAILEDPA